MGVFTSTRKGSSNGFFSPLNENIKYNRVWLVLTLFALSSQAWAQTVKWKWEKGNRALNGSGSYSSPYKAGARTEGNAWTDSNGDVWLFGGIGRASTSSTGRLNDLWMYDVSSGNWTWHSGSNTTNQNGTYGSKGTSGSSNTPGARSAAASWIDSNGDLWVFGGYGYPKAGSAGYLNDLWKYDVSADEWTWMSGVYTTNANGTYGTVDVGASSNTPGARSQATYWTDASGDFWLFGGKGAGATGGVGLLNDLWQYDVSAGQWIWRKGNKAIGKLFVYGTKGTASTSNKPGGLQKATGSLSADGDLLLFGGFGNTASSQGDLNDLWSYNIASASWTWLAGSADTSTNHNKGTIRVEASSNDPGARVNAASWTGALGDFYVYGGLYKDSPYADLWKWDGTHWTWIKGGSNSSTEYGTKGTFSSSNRPGIRHGSLICGNTTTGLWLYGGDSVATSGSKFFASLWKLSVTYSIENNGINTESKDGLSFSGSESSGNALQTSGDWIMLNGVAYDFTEVTQNLPASSNVAAKYKKTWKLGFNDASSNGGLLTLAINTGQAVNTERSYYLLKFTSGTYTVVNTVDYKISGSSVIFTVDLSDLTSGVWYQLGWSSADAGYALYFNKASTPDQVDLPISLNSLSQTYTVECWIRPTSTSGTQYIIDQNNGTGTARALFRIKAGGYLYTKLGGTDKQSARNISANKWTHVAMTHTKTYTKFYINGRLDTTHALTAEDCDGSWIVGCSRGGSNGLKGEMDEMRIWTTERTENQIRANMHTLLSGNENGLLSYYKFDQASDTHLPDVSANAYGGTLSNFALSGSTSNWVTSSAPVVQNSQSKHLIGPGNGLEFDGSNDYVSVDNFLDPSSSNWSIEGWFYIDALDKKLMSQLNGSSSSVGRNYLTISSSGLILTNLGGTTLTGSKTLSTGEWYHIAITFNGANIMAYVNGILDINGSASISTCDGKLQIGCNKARTSFFDGKMDELRFWSTTRSQANIQDNMYASFDYDKTGLQAYYTCDEFFGTTLPDATSNDNDGTLKNFPNACWVSATAREPFKSINDGSHNTGSTWKDGVAPSSATDKLAVFNDVTISAISTYEALHVSSGVTLTTSNKISVTGDVVINGTLTGSNKLQLSGSSKQTLSGSGTIGDIKINNSSDISLAGDLTITGALDLTSGDIEINDYDLTLNGTTTHGSSTSYIKLNGTGGVKTTVGADPVILPVGRNPYLPIIIDDGGGAEYTVGVADKVYSNPTTQTTELTSDCVSETWTVQASQAVSNVNIQIGWDGAEEETGFDRTKSTVSYWENGVSSSWNNGTRGAATGSDPYFRTIDMSSMSTNLYYFGVGSGSSPLPVELSYFTARWLEPGQSATLEWETASETDNSHFEIERSFDGVSFENVGRVEGQGNTITTTNYTFMDGRLEESSKPTIYYRLKQVDFNGEYAYSGVHALHVEGESISNVRLFPNPVHSTLYISSDTEIAHINIYNSLGVRVQTAAYGSNTMDVSGLPAGQYFLEAIPASGNERLPKHRFMVN